MPSELSKQSRDMSPVRLTADRSGTLAAPAAPAAEGNVGDPDASRRRRTYRHRTAGRRARGLVGIVAAFAVWELVSGLQLISSTNLPSISAVAQAFGDQWHPLLSSVGTTVESLFIGLAIGSIAGAILGLAAGLSVWGDAATDMIVRMARPLPSLALIPIAILVAGLGMEMTSGLVAFAAFWPVFINARYAVRQVEPRLLDSGRAVGFGQLGLILRVVVPSAAPEIATGVRISAGIATLVTVSVELVAGTGGLGGYVLTAEQGTATADMYAGIILGGILGWVINNLVSIGTRRAFPWDAARSAEAR